MKQKIKKAIKVPIFILSAFYVFWTYFFYRDYFLKGRFLVSFSSLGRIFSNVRYPHSFSLARFIVSMGHYLLLLAGLGIMCLIALAIGRKILRLLRVEGESILEASIFALGLGFGSLSLMMFFLGILKLYYTWVIYCVLGILSIFSFFELRRIKLPQFPSLPTRQESTIVVIFLCVILGIAALINLIGAFAPPIFYDALVFHLAVSSLYKIGHGIRYLETIFTSHFPQNMQMLYTLSLLLGTDILAKLIHWVMGVFAVILVFAFGRKYFDYRVGLLAGTIFYTIPMVAMQSRATGVDLSLSLYELSAVFALANWAIINRKAERPRVNNGWLTLAAIFNGLAMGVKYTAIYSFLLFAVSVLLVSILIHKLRLRISLKRTFLFCVVAIALFSPWLIKNTVYTGNPFHPFLSNVFKSKDLYLGSEYTPLDTIYLDKEAKKWDRFPTRNIREWLIFPWTLTKGGNDSNSFVGPILLYLLPLLFFLRKDDLTKFLILLGSVWFLTWSLIATRNLRYFISGLALFAIIVSYLLLRTEKENRFFSRIVLFLVSLMFVNNVGWSLIILTTSRDPWGVFLGRESREEYLSRDRIGYNLMPYYYPVVDYINKNLPMDAKVLFIGESRGYYCERDFVVTLVEDPYSIVTRLVRFCKDTDELLKKLRSMSITHVLYNRREAYRLRGYKIFDWQDDEFSIFSKFWRNNLKLLYAENDVYVFEVRYEGNEPINYVEIYESSQVEGYMMEARRLIARNDTAQALKLLQQAKKMVPDSAAIHFNLGLVYLNRRNFDEAIKECNLSISLNPYNPEVHFLLGYLYFQKNDFVPAAESYRKGIELNPNLAEGHGYLGFAYAKMKKYKEAIEELRTAVRLDPENENFKNMLRSLEQKYRVEGRRGR